MDFTDILKSSRDNLGLTIREAADKLGVSIGYLSELENGLSGKPKMAFLYAICEHYALNLDEVCISTERIPRDVFYKIVQNPKLLNIIRNYEV